MLQDLKLLAQEAKERRELYLNEELILPDEFKNLYKIKFPNSRLIFENYSSVDYTSQGLSIVIPNQWFIIASFFTKFLNELMAYKNIVMPLFNSEEIKIFRDTKSLGDKLHLLENVLPNETEREFVIKFLTDYNWWNGSKTIDRGDFFVSAILNLASVVHLTQGHIANLAYQLNSHNELVELLLQRVESKKSDTINVVDQFAIWLNEKPRNNYFENDFGKTVRYLKKLAEKYNEIFEDNLFELQSNNINAFIERLNKNIWDEHSEFWEYSSKASNHQPRAILNGDNYQTFLKEILANKNTNKIAAKNIIYYGAPGTGKSFKIDQIVKNLDSKYYERITFHPEFDNASFVGGYKPVSEKDEDGKDVVNYKFAPQAFANIYIRAWNDINNQYYLVIEEINRGNCAEIFGEIFQLLDRNSDYTVSASKELKEHLISVFAAGREHDGINKGLKLPPNLHILATMNTSDQSLFPMDSAFKRRWDWEYVPICYTPSDEEGKQNTSYNYQIELPDGSKFRWIDFILKINNNHIKNNLSLGMDKCIGNYFIKPDSGNSISLKPFINKVIFYLWNDVFKDEDNRIFEVNSSYEDFFPVTGSGEEKVKALFERIELLPMATVSLPEEEEFTEIGQPI